MNLSVVRFLDRSVGVPLCRGLVRVVKPRTTAAPTDDPKRILIMRGPGVGNLVLMQPTLKALRDRFPNARIDAVTLASNRGFLERLGYFSRIWYLNDRSVGNFFTSFAKVFPTLRRVHYDLFIDFEQFAKTSAIVSLLLRIPRRIGFLIHGQGREAAYTDGVSFPYHLHTMDAFHTLVEPLGVAPARHLRALPVPFTATERQNIEDLLAAEKISPDDRIAVIHPGTGENFILRRWPEDRFAAVADFLAQQGFKVVLTGGRSEAELVARVANEMKMPAFNAVGKLTLGELLALLKRATLVISNDTGPLHLATTQGTPTVGLYGPNTPTLYGPRGEYDITLYLGLPCSPCMTNSNDKSSSCRNNICMKLMTVDQVIASLSRIFEGQAVMPAFLGGVRPIPTSPAVHPLLIRRPPVERSRPA